MSVRLQTRGFNDLVVEFRAGGGFPGIWKTTVPVKRYTWPCLDHVIDVVALPETPMTLAAVSTEFGPSALNGRGQCVVPSSIQVLFTDFKELPLVHFGVPFP
jgi:hypothetical protein